MNTVQTQTTIAPLIAFVAGLLAGKGVFGLDAATWATILGGAVAFGVTIWTAFTTSKKALITSVANQAEVKAVVLEDTAPASLVNETPSNVAKAPKK